MSKSIESDPYTKGLNCVLDQKYSAYKRMNPWSGPAISNVLTEEEIGIMAKIWRIEIFSPMKLSVQDVSQLVAGFSFFYLKRLQI